MVRLICEEDGWPQAKVVFDPDKPTVIPVRLVKVDKVLNLYGFKARTDLREGIKKTLAWYRANEAIVKK